MTNYRNGIGMFPLATGAGAEGNGLAWVIIGGLISPFPYFNSSTCYL
jgi:multidrug efflux pump subunit AcrB